MLVNAYITSKQFTTHLKSMEAALLYSSNILFEVLNVNNISALIQAVRRVVDSLVSVALVLRLSTKRVSE